jgi:NAD(P)-dependent dehydrogenase (short-subunit alcohol dehydrogenase family)
VVREREKTVLDSMRLDGKVALVTGGSQGLGLGIAEALAEAGASVAIAARRHDRLQEAASRIEAHGHPVQAVQADLRDLAAVRDVIDSTCNRFGHIDILVTSAAAQLRKPILEVTPDEWDEMVSINQRSVFFLCQETARRMIERPDESESGVRGKIINIASLTAVGAWPNVSVYGMTKGGVVQMTKAMALEWASLGVCVNALGPGTFHTELTDPLYTDPGRSARIVERIPLGRPGIPRDLAGAAVFLASPASDYVTGQVLWVDGGYLVLGGGL